MFRPFRTLTVPAVLAIAVMALSACAERAPQRSSGSAPAVTQSAPAQSAPRTTPAPGASTRTDDQSLRLDNEMTGVGSCRTQCERSHNMCMDSVAARTQSGVERPDRAGPFTPMDNCGDELRRCYQRCNTAR
ncbi:hypothetical protein [Azospirillum thermophilum]|uniref:Uncharacterized protein n=1 Tax=Azospirillum thermophilum TaxID=2202148 RepID=A0A2S2CZZ8_9PROT|nr:hypothetical protein [Azospirillum thermophilum]AWK90015.1 hypothetical protein DEW08_28890 [Azospirillum thermophilum]